MRNHLRRLGRYVMKRGAKSILWNKTLVPFILVIALVALSGPVWAQATSAKKKDTAPAEVPKTDNSELAHAEKEMKSRFKPFKRLKEKHKSLMASIKRQQTELAQLKADGNEKESAIAAERLKADEDQLLAVSQEFKSAEKLYDKALERYQNLAKGKKEGEGQKALIADALERKKLAEQATMNAQAASDDASTVKAELDLLAERRLILQGEADTVADQLIMKKLPKARRNELKDKLNQLMDEIDDVVEQIGVRNLELIQAEATFRIKSRQAQIEAEDFARWRREMLRSVFTLIAITFFLLLIRLIVRRSVKDPQKRHTYSSNLSIFTFFVVIVGLMIIFIENLSVLITGVGVAAAGLAIALREIVASFFAWFVIRGSKGYQVGDWIQIGNFYGEVIDIGLLITILAQVTPLEPGGDKGGSWTGGMVYLPNNSAFNEKMVNFTRGYPYIWARLVFTVTYESDWKKAEKMLFSAVDNEEILETTKKAREELDKMATNFAIKLENTRPIIRTAAADSGIELKLLFLVHPRRRRALMDRISRHVMEAVDRADDVDFAYNTVRVIPNPVAPEGGSGEDNK